MVGFRACYVSGELTPDGKEIEEAGWFSRATLPEIPRLGTIAGSSLTAAERVDPTSATCGSKIDLLDSEFSDSVFSRIDRPDSSSVVRRQQFKHLSVKLVRIECTSFPVHNFAAGRDDHRVGRGPCHSGSNAFD